MNAQDRTNVAILADDEVRSKPGHCRLHTRFVYGCASGATFALRTPIARTDFTPLPLQQSILALYRGDDSNYD
jgi:hypothetical protein